MPNRAGPFAFLITAILASGCSSTSVLVHPRDPTFAQAEDRLEATRRLIDETGAPQAECSLFLQAEGFYEYRFEPTARSVQSFLAEAAAAATDFPAFQSLAGSFDLFGLRVRAKDAAIQLWETLLVRYPKTRMRPLALYRLGWAYRSVGVSGFPRENPNQAFDQLISEEPHSQLADYAREAKGIPWKSKSSAMTRSLIPGLGQFYVGDGASGAVRLAVALAAAAAVAYPAYLGIKNKGLSLPMAALGIGGLIVLSFDYTSSYEDAQRGVVLWNERAENHFNEMHPGAP